MANFYEAFKITMKYEGGYANDPDDIGGETYKGIARKYNPNWKGWSIIDSYKDFTNFPKCLNEDIKLQDLVISLYKQKYWDPYLGDVLDQIIANEMFDTAVNIGVYRAIKFLQKGLNLLNRNGKLYSDIIEDGDFGPKTLNAYNNLPKPDLNILYNIMNILQGMHYIEYMTKSPIQEKFARGWFKRIDIRKT